MFTWALLITSSICLFILGLYFLGYVAITLHQLFFQPHPLSEEKASAEKITILIPSYNEGDSVIDTVESLKLQDIASTLYIDILIKDESDTSYAPLKKQYKNFIHNDFFKVAKKRFLRVHCTGLQYKNEKINVVLQDTDTRYVAFLDADHRAAKSWLKDSLNVLAETNTRIVQSRRGPLSLNGFFKAWDSLQNHIGNEVINRFLSRIGQTSYFTGTTCVFETDLIKEKGFPDSITEDTYLTYQMFSEGEKISYNPHSGSFEEMAPDVHSYIARRRRWSCGHNQTLKDFFPKVFSLPGFTLGEKSQLGLHLFYYFLPVVIFLQQLFYGFHFLLQYSKDVQYLTLAVTGAIATLLCLLFSTKIKQFLQNLPLAFLWTLPFVSFFSVYVYKLTDNELYYQVTALPYVDTLFFLHVGFIASPLLILLVGAGQLERPSLWLLLGVILTYPLVLFLDIFASLIGLLDLILRRKEWGTISRSSDIDEDLKEIEVSLTGRRRKVNLLLLTGLPSLVFLLILYNDLMPRDHCGYKDYLFGNSILFTMESDIQAHNRIQKTREGNNVTVSVQSQITNPLEKNLEVFYVVDGVSGKPHHSREKNFVVNLARTYPMGWEHKKAVLEIKGPGTHCSRKVGFNTTHTEIRGKQLYINGEPFLVKGMIPSFIEHKANLPLKEGIQQIKRTGANTIRLYHTPSEKYLTLCQQRNLLIISQPDETTWKNLDITSRNILEDYIRQFRKHIHKLDGHPSQLLFNLGNELEVNHKHEEAIPKLFDLIKEANDSSFYRFPTTYSTFLTYLNHPADILSINMLDSGKTYWEKALPMLGKLNKPFLASEFGGFVAFSESTETDLRADRMYRYWSALLKNGALGAIFFQSHDNWAQPVPSGHNDPFSPDHFDDTRGYWTQENKEKPELYHLRQIFNDLPLRIIKASKEGYLFEAQNIRPYQLTDVRFLADDMNRELKTLSPNQKVTFVVPRGKLVNNVLPYELKYTTHMGLQQHFVHQYHANPESLSPKIEYAPLFQEYKSERKYRPFQKPIPDPGEITLKISLDKTVAPSEAYLLLDGIGAPEITLVDEREKPLLRFRTHYYREVFLPLDKIRKYIRGGFLYIRINRNQTTYISGKDSPTGQPIEISLSPVKLLRMKP